MNSGSTCLVCKSTHLYFPLCKGKFNLPLRDNVLIKISNKKNRQIHTWVSICIVVRVGWQMNFNMCEHQYSEWGLFWEQSIVTAIQELNKPSHDLKCSPCIIEITHNYGIDRQRSMIPFSYAKAIHNSFQTLSMFCFFIGCNSCSLWVPPFLLMMWWNLLIFYSDLFFTVSFELIYLRSNKGRTSIVARGNIRNEFYPVWNRLSPWKDCQ